MLQSRINRSSKEATVKPWLLLPEKHRQRPSQRYPIDGHLGPKGGSHLPSVQPGRRTPRQISAFSSHSPIFCHVRLTRRVVRLQCCTRFFAPCMLIKWSTLRRHNCSSWYRGPNSSSTHSRFVYKVSGASTTWTSLKLRSSIEGLAPWLLYSARPCQYVKRRNIETSISIYLKESTAAMQPFLFAHHFFLSKTGHPRSNVRGIRSVKTRSLAAEHVSYPCVLNLYGSQLSHSFAGPVLPTTLLPHAWSGVTLQIPGSRS